MTRLKSFSKAGHFPTLISSLLYFDVSFMIWVLFGATSNFIATDLQLSDAQKGMMVAIPILGGAFLRLPLGILADRYGGKRVGLIGMAVTMIPLAATALFADQIHEIYAYGILLGIAGASFAVALPLAGRWYPPEHQGLAMGLVGAGNSGTALAMLFAPRLSEMFGWNAVFGLALIPLVIVFILFSIFVKDSPNQPKQVKFADFISIMKRLDSWYLCLVYSLCFGSFVGLSSYLSIFFFDYYHVSKVQSGDFVTFLAFTASFIRPVGGYLADRFGGTYILQYIFLSISFLLFMIGFLPPILLAIVLFFLLMLSLGLANGALFQVIPNMYRENVGVITGLVGAAGGFGGFFLPNILATMKQLTGTYSYGYWWIAATALTITALLIKLKDRWTHISSNS
ncbi:MFS transporter [Desulfuribacillus stibiiarsenatis]|uniref:MFS transporter n=1 Tax=Desulfuribacillus stibiiarsenatis TaxID=1390249 RepID=A0A1E5L2X1_9FIRM|nr:nitrate/nitrite transporter [Desulfuribacillus stibiiarsenatis]OEH84488.1 MFS transporter [Desulfuribacillus stibiiarsenatis]